MLSISKTGRANEIISFLIIIFRRSRNSLGNHPPSICRWKYCFFGLRKKIWKIRKQNTEWNARIVENSGVGKFFCIFNCVEFDCSSGRCRSVWKSLSDWSTVTFCRLFISHTQRNTNFQHISAYNRDNCECEEKIIQFFLLKNFRIWVFFVCSRWLCKCS